MKSGAELKVAVVGSRKFNNLPLLMMAVDKLNPAMIVSGGAQGADSLGQLYAKLRGLVVVIYYPDWSVGKGAALLRNVQIANMADVCVAFPIGASSGTRHCVRKFEYYHKPVYVLECDENSQLIL